MNLASTHRKDRVTNMPISNKECISILEYELCRLENVETFILENECDKDELRSIEKEIEAHRRAIRYLEKYGRKKA